MSTDTAPKGPKDRGSSGVMPVSGTRYRPGQLIVDKYQLVKKLGEGGMGEVWVAHDRVLDVDCAIKLIELEPTDEARALTQRLLNEARAAAKLGHAAIVRVSDFGETRFGDPFFAMELLEGEDLAQVMARERRLEPTRAVQMLLPIAHALASAHAKGIVHRDVKPENIFLAKDAVCTVQPKLLDFGVMRMLDRPRKLTIDGVVVGTPDYMSPEQARGETSTGQTDLWSLCVVLYELIVGRRPFDGDNYNALMRSIIENEPATLEALGLADADLSAIVARGMEKSVDERWISVLELGEELALWLESKGVSEDITGTSLRRAWLNATESQRIELPPYVLEQIEKMERESPKSTRRRSPEEREPRPASGSQRAPTGSGPRPIPRAEATGSHGAQNSEPELRAIADMNEGGDPEQMLRRESRKKTLLLVAVLIVMVAVAVVGVLAGTGIVVLGPDVR